MIVKYIFCHDLIKKEDFIQAEISFEEKNKRDIFLWLCSKHDLCSSGLSQGGQHTVSVIIPSKEYMGILFGEFKQLKFN